MLRKDKVLNNILLLSKKFPDIKFGLAGSYAIGSQSEDSDVDIILDADRSIMGDVQINTELYQDAENMFKKLPFDLVWLPLVKEDLEKSDKLALELGIGINENSPYRSIIREVIWIGEQPTER